MFKRLFCAIHLMASTGQQGLRRVLMQLGLGSDDITHIHVHSYPVSLEGAEESSSAIKQYKSEMFAITNFACLDTF